MKLVPESAGANAGTVPIASEKYVRELDGIRAIAVAIVVFTHYRLLPYMPGGFGVTLFFFLSGYLITTLFFAEYNSARDINIPRFYLRRWLRLTPPLIISVVLAVLFYKVTRVGVDGQPVPVGTSMAALFYYTNYYDLFWNMDPNKVVPFGICWSLAIEEHFYLMWPLMLRRAIGNPQRLSIAIAVICLMLLFWRFLCHYVLLMSSDYTYMATDCRIDSILYGALLRVLFESNWKAAAFRILRTRLCRALGIALLLVAFFIRDDGFRQTLRYTIQGIALMPVFTAILSDDPATLIRRVLSSQPMVLIGRLSYSIYLFHLLARTPGEYFLKSPYAAGTEISGLLLTGGTAYALFIFVERPLGRLRHRFRAKGVVSSHSPTAISSPMEAPVIGLPQEP